MGYAAAPPSTSSKPQRTGIKALNAYPENRFLLSLSSKACPSYLQIGFTPSANKKRITVLLDEDRQWSCNVERSATPPTTTTKDE
ncbi:hypothetical protein TNCV_5056481 [Trichonephila clavipes]|nr:hypothetical protein TNCV_5056481 [Trichonephila clavipes]